jgi:hypothetical protein
MWYLQWDRHPRADFFAMLFGTMLGPMLAMRVERVLLALG